MVKVIQNIIKQSQLRRLGRDWKGQVRCSMVIFIGLRASLLLAGYMRLRKYKDLAELKETRLKDIVSIDALHEVLEEVHKIVVKKNSASRTDSKNCITVKPTCSSSMFT